MRNILEGRTNGNTSWIQQRYWTPIQLHAMKNLPIFILKIQVSKMMQYI